MIHLKSFLALFLGILILNSVAWGKTHPVQPKASHPAASEPAPNAETVSPSAGAMHPSAPALPSDLAAQPTDRDRNPLEAGIAPPPPPAPGYSDRADIPDSRREYEDEAMGQMGNEYGQDFGAGGIGAGRSSFEEENVRAMTAPPPIRPDEEFDYDDGAGQAAAVPPPVAPPPAANVDGYDEGQVPSPF